MTLIQILAVAWVSFVAPSNDNMELDCSKPPIYAPNSSDSVVCHIAWTGNGAGQDSIKLRKGMIGKLPVVYSSPGIYTVRAWASDRGGVSCPTFLSLFLGDQLRPDSLRILR